jgi:hypothetical protein
VDEQLKEKPSTDLKSSGEEQPGSARGEVIGGAMVTQESHKPDDNTYWVEPGKLLAGEYPVARDPEEARKRLRRFLASGVRHFIDLSYRLLVAGGRADTR